MSTQDLTGTLVIGDEVADAMRDGTPVVALESSGIPHGMPYPLNRDTAIDMHKAIRAAGAVPARVGIIDGQFVVGLSDEQIEMFATASDITKASTRDIGQAMAGGGLGAPTVSAAMVAAEQVGIKVVAVAGLGGVHFNAQQTFDISSDLIQLTRHRMAVVCAGAKTVLDPALTLEYLETMGIPVVGYRCDDFPAYYSVSSGQRNPARIDDLTVLAKAIEAHWRVGNNTSFLVTHPIAESEAMPADEVYSLIHEKLAEAQRAGISGPAVTPYILGAVSSATKGRTSAANRAVLLSTSALAGEVAVALSARLRERNAA
jgi:pseudouridine-5'-phosphate glycosidase